MMRDKNGILQRVSWDKALDTIAAKCQDIKDMHGAISVALAMINVIISEQLYDEEFITKNTVGFDELRDHVKAYTPEKVSDICGVPLSDIYQISRIFAQAKGCLYRAGNQHPGSANPVASWPDSKKIAEAFKKLDLLVVSDIFMNETARLADIVLPVCTSVETVGLAYNYALTMGIPFAMFNKKLIEPIGESKPDWWIYSQLGRKMGYGEYFPWNTDEEVVDHML
jgi:anaerobic selenocysteine-containing dehydrogenase